MHIVLDTEKPFRYGKVGAVYDHPTWFKPPLLCSTAITDSIEFKGVILDVQSSNIYDWVVYSLKDLKRFTFRDLIKFHGEFLMSCLLVPVELVSDGNFHWVPLTSANPMNVCGFTTRHPSDQIATCPPHNAINAALSKCGQPMVNLLTLDVYKSTTYKNLLQIDSRRKRAAIIYKENQKLNMEAMKKYMETVLPITTVHVGDLPDDYKTATMTYEDKCTQPEDYTCDKIRDQQTLKLCLWHTASRYKLGDHKMPCIRSICGYTTLPEGRPKICVMTKEIMEPVWIDLQLAFNRVKGIISSFKKSPPSYLTNYITIVENLYTNHVGPDEEDETLGKCLHERIQEEKESNLTYDTKREEYITILARKIGGSNYEPYLEQAKDEFEKLEECQQQLTMQLSYRQIHDHPEKMDYNRDELRDFVNTRSKYNLSLAISKYFTVY